MTTDSMKQARPHRSRARGEAGAIQRWVRIIDRISTPLAAWLALRIWRMTRRYPVPPREAEWLRTAQSEILQLAGKRIQVHCWGDDSRPAVWLVHGWGGRGSQMAAFAEPLTAAGYFVLALDLPGHGQSAGHSTDLFECNCVLQALQRQRGAPAAVVAHSFGVVAGTYALRQGLRANSAVMIGAPFSGEKIFAAYINWLAPPQRVADHLVRRIKHKLREDVFECLSPGQHAPHLQLPCLILHDEDDADVPVDAAEQLASVWPGAEFVRTQGLGHRRILREEDCIQRAKDFIAESQALLARSQSRQTKNSDS